MTSALQVPPLPAAHARTLALLLDRDVGLSEVAAVIEGDPGLTATVLRAANSAASAPVSRIVRAGDGIVRLGARTARALIVASMLQAQANELRRAQIDLEELWRHVIATGLVADASGTAAGRDARAPAFTAGLLHDVGRIAMAAQQPLYYARVVRMAREGHSILEAERAVFGVDHGEFGIDVARAWALPEELAAPISAHHAPFSSAMSPHVQAGRAAAAALGFGDGVLPAGDPRLCEGIEVADATVLAGLGGAKQIVRRIEWFRGALGAG